MTSDGQAIERLRAYLRTLKPAARSMLIQELERSLLRGEESAANELVLQELRRAIREEAQPVPRIGDAARLFFAPLEPFLIDAPPDHKRLGRIARATLAPIWAWLGRELPLADAGQLGDDINQMLLAGNRAGADLAVRRLQERAIEHIRELVVECGNDERSRRKLASQVGTHRALDDLRAIAAVLSQRDMLADLLRRLPAPSIRNFDRELSETFKAFLDSAASAASRNNTLPRADVYLCGLVALMGKLAAPWQLIRIATRAAESDDALRVADTPYAVAVTLVLNEVEQMVRELAAELRARRPVILLLKGIHDAARGLRTEVDLSDDSAWARQLRAIRAEVSGILKNEIDTTPGCVRRLLRPRPAKDIAPGSVLDQIDVSDAEMRVEFISACRSYASELAVNEATMRAHSELTVHLETGTKVLLDSLRHAGDADQPFRQSQVDAAIRFCRAVFGNEYASLLAKAAEVAISAGAADRKLARA
jgi:hypothetical protein